jgi:hypothetical protein
MLERKAPTTSLAAIIDEGGAVDVEWLSEKLGQRVASAQLRDQEKMGGMSGAEFRFIDVVLADDEMEDLALVLKQSAPSSKGAMMGLAREAYFYSELSSGLVGAGVPRCYYAAGDMATGETLILAESLQDSVPAGVFFGPGNPNNWAIAANLPALSEGNPGALEVTRKAFSLYAQLHAAHWQDAALLDGKPWVRGADWYTGHGEAGWTGAQRMASEGWLAAMEQRDAGKAEIKWDEHLVACMQASFVATSWASFQSERKDRPFALVHGDAHPHNQLWTQQRTPEARLRLIDFEMIGVGSPAQELGQFLISHMDPELRRTHERELVGGYHAEVVAALHARGMEAEAATFTLESCFAEYIAGGVGRWVWFIPLFWQTTPVAQFFHDQLAAFLTDHVADPASMPMPRV